MAGASDLEFCVLGPVEVCDSGGNLPLGGPKQRALLADLILNAGTVVSAARLIDDLWGGHLAGDRRPHGGDLHRPPPPRSP
jgi:DNA-binding response OmpR family regulator